MFVLFQLLVYSEKLDKPWQPRAVRYLYVCSLSAAGLQWEARPTLTVPGLWGTCMFVLFQLLVYSEKRDQPWQPRAVRYLYVCSLSAAGLQWEARPTLTVPGLWGTCMFVLFQLLVYSEKLDQPWQPRAVRYLYVCSLSAAGLQWEARPTLTAQGCEVPVCLFSFSCWFTVRS